MPLILHTHKNSTLCIDETIDITFSSDFRLTDALLFERGNIWLKPTSIEEIELLRIGS